MRVISSENDIWKLVIGGAVLGGGGGGSIEEGLELGRTALSIGNITVLSIDELGDDKLVATTSTVGSQAKGAGVLKPFNHIEAARLLANEVERLGGLISCENGGLNTVCPFPQSAALGIPVIDAPCDGRAHPTALMGSMGLHRVKGYTSIQAFSVGLPGSEKRATGVLKGGLEEVSRIIRWVASEHGAVAVARNPVDKKYLREHAAVGALELAFSVGEIFACADNALELSYKIAERLGGSVIENCVVEQVELEVRGGFDVGFSIIAKNGERYELTFVNEFMTLEKNGSRIATFPDLITLIDKNRARPVLSAELKRGVEAHIIVVDRKKIPIGYGLRCKEVYEPIEKALNKPMTGFISDILV